MIYCNCYQRFKKCDFEVNASLKKIKKITINAEEFYNRINNAQKREDPGNEDLFLLIAIVTYSKYFFCEWTLVQETNLRKFKFFQETGKVIHTTLRVRCFSCSEIKKFITWNPETAYVFASHTTLNPF